MIKTFEAELIHKEEVAPNIFFLKYKRPLNIDFEYQAGQYMIFHIFSNDSKNSVRRLYSIASSPSNKYSLDFIIELVSDGVGSGYFKKSQLGDKITLQGPAGLFTLKKSEDLKTIFMATGTGIAPILSMLYEKLHSHNKSETVLFWGIKKLSDVYLIAQLNELSVKFPNFHYQICLSRETNELNNPFIKGHVGDALSQYLQKHSTNIKDYKFYLCGSKNAVDSIKSDLVSQGALSESIHFEKFT